jgi:DnaJ domain
MDTSKLHHCLRTLDLEPGATMVDAKRSYRELVKVWHPDRFGHDTALLNRAQEKLKQINLAYELLEHLLSNQEHHPEPTRQDKSAPPDTKPAATASYAAKPDARKSGPKPVAKPAAKSAGRAPNLGLGIAGACVGAIIGAILWLVFLKSTSATPIDPKSTPLTTIWMAIVVGVLAGVGARLMGRTKAPALGGAACVCATLVIGIMAWQAMNSYIDRILAPQLKSQYDSALANAMSATKATDAELKVFIARNTPSASMDGNVNVSDEALRTYRATQLPILRDFAAGKPSREAWEATKRSAMRAHYPFEEAWQESIGSFGLLFLLAGILAAAKIPMK